MPIRDHIKTIWKSCLTWLESRPPPDWTNLRSSFPESRSEFLSTTKRIGDVGERFSEPGWRLGGPIENSGKKISGSGFEWKLRIQVEKEVKNKQNGVEGGKRNIKNIKNSLKLKKSSTQNVLQHDRLEFS
jgi:hypothetical protein